MFCSPVCAITQLELNKEKLAQKKQKESKKTDNKRKREFRENDRSLQLKLAQAEFNKFIRLRDAHLPCISCQRFHEGRYDADHYLSIGAHPEHRFNEDNCHKQCHWHCNIQQSGNIKNYRIELVKKIGIEKVQNLEAYKKPEKLSIEDIRAIKVKYKQAVKNF